MIAKLKELVVGQAAGPTTTVRLTRAVRVHDEDGDLVGGMPGDTFRVAKDEAHHLEAIGAAQIVLSAGDEAERDRRESELAALIPPPVEPQPLPEGMTDLPQPFADWWNLRERRRCIAARSELIMQRFRQEWGTIGASDRQLDNLDRIRDPDDRRELVGKLLGARIRIIRDDPERFRRLEKLKEALYRSWTALAEFDDDERAARWKAKLAAGDVTKAACWRATKACRELATIGFRIYRTRIAAMALVESEERRLFRRSTDGERYLHDEPKLGNLRLAWVGDDGTSRTFLDLELEAMATRFRQFRDQADRLEAELKDAKRALKKAEAA